MTVYKTALINWPPILYTVENKHEYLDYYITFLFFLYMCVCVCITRDSRNEHPWTSFFFLYTHFGTCRSALPVPRKGIFPFFFSQMPRVIFKTQLQSFFFILTFSSSPTIYIYIYIYIPWENVCLQDLHEGRICLWGRHLYSRKKTPFFYFYTTPFHICLLFIRMVCVCIIGFIFLLL